MNWLHSLLLGFAGGLCELLPLSAQANRGLLRQILGVPSEGALFSLLCRGAVMLVLLSSGLLEVRRLRRTAKLQRMTYRRRTGQPSLNESGTLRLMRIALPMAFIGGMLSVRLADVADRLWLVTIPLVLGGLLLWLPTHMHRANKDGRHLTGLDAMLMGLGALAAAVPGVSPMAAVFAIGTMRGAQQRYALRFSCIMMAIWQLGAMVMELLTIVSYGFSFGAAELLSAGLGAGSAALGAYLAVLMLRSLTRPGAAGMFGFCYYNWGQALLSMVLFLLV